MSEVENKITPPEWLDAAFIQQNLRPSFGKDFRILECTIMPATAVGDNYASHMFRAHLKIQKTNKGQPENLQIVIKSLPEGKIAETLQECHFFSKEGKMFTTILPKLNTILRRALPDHDDFNAGCYFTQGSPRDLIVLEDLRVLDFTLGDRRNGLNLEHVTLVLKNLARYHAASVVLLKEDPLVLEEYNETVWCEKHESLMSKMMKEGMVNMAEAAGTWDLPDRKYFVKKLLELEHTILPRTYKMFQKDDSKLNVLLHGDCWVNNMMFRYSNNKPVAIRFVDYQICSLNSPALDLVYFFFTSVTDELRRSYIPDMLKIYHDHFTATLNSLNFKLNQPFTLQDLTNEYYEKLFFGFVSLAIVFPITAANQKDAPNINDLMDSESDVKHNHLYENERLQQAATAALPYFQKHGVFGE